jgi:hypothetical protein
MDEPLERLSHTDETRWAERRREESRYRPPTRSLDFWVSILIANGWLWVSVLSQGSRAALAIVAGGIYGGAALWEEHHRG